MSIFSLCFQDKPLSLKTKIQRQLFDSRYYYYYIGHSGRRAAPCALLVLKAHGLHPPKIWFVGARANYLQLLNVAIAMPDHKNLSLWELKSYLDVSKLLVCIACMHTDFSHFPSSLPDGTLLRDSAIKFLTFIS